MYEDLSAVVLRLPDSPGVYRFYNSDGELIYVGKAKNIRKRVSSYFNKNSGVSGKTLKLVSEIITIEYTVSNSEFDALLLENNFIKQNQPKYNILLKDDKTFPYLCILKERFPRIIYTRKYQPKQGEYFGPYSSVVSMKSVLELVRKLYSIRTCNLLLSEENVEKKKFKVCLEYHLGNCRGPCEGLQDEVSYLNDIAQARNVLKGNLSIVEDYFHDNMKSASEAMEFERANLFKHKLDLLEKFQAKSMVVNRKLTDIDVVTITATEKDAFINYLQIKEGAIVFSKNVEIKKKLEETNEEILTIVTQQLRLETNSANKIIYSNIPLQITEETIENVVPQIGDKKRLIDLSLKNVLYLKAKKEITKEETKIRNIEVLKDLQRDLQLK